jgi:hypothetical protein
LNRRAKIIENVNLKMHIADLKANTYILPALLGRQLARCVGRLTVATLFNLYK